MLLLLTSIAVAQQPITISNIEPRLDAQGQIIDAHDGRVIQFGEKFYWYGTRYGDTSGFTTANTYVCYSSTNMQTWSYEGELLANAPAGVYYRPHVVYHQKRKRYVLWYNWYPKLWEGQFGVAESKSPTGPFKIVNADVQVKHSEIGVGDFGLFVDDDQTAYLTYNTIQGHRVSAERLSPDYRSSAMENGGFIAEHCEAGSMFKRNGKYYILTDYTCCFCGEGSGARVYISDNPLTGYQQYGNINRYPGRPTPQLTDGQFSAFNTVELKSGEGVLVQAGEAVSSLTLTLAWANYRTHCQPDNTELQHPKDITPQFSLHQGEARIEPQEVRVENQYNRLVLHYRFPEPLPGSFTVQLDTAVYLPLKVAELALHTTGGASVQAQAYKTGGQPVIIPAQQTHIMQLLTPEGYAYSWMGDLWGSRPDNVKGHDQQYWSAPLKFNADGTIQQLEWTDRWSITVLPQKP